MIFSKRVRRRILITILTASVGLVIVAALGVFSPPMGVRIDGVAIGPGNEVNITGLRIEGPDWVLTAEHAVRKPGGEFELERPVMVQKQLAAPGTRARQTTVRADHGWKPSRDSEDIRLKGRVFIETHSEAEVSTLRCENLTWNAESGGGAVTGAVTLVSRNGPTTYRASGEDAIAEMRAQHVRLERKVEVVISGETRMLPGDKTPASGAAAPLDVHVTCSGPMDVEGNVHSVTFTKEVVVTRGDDQMLADMLKVFLAREGGGIEELVAVGKVRLRSGDMHGTCDKLARDRLGVMTLTGAPARLAQGNTEFIADAVTLAAEGSGLRARTPGRLVFVVGEGDAARRSEISWKDQMEYDRAKGLAFFRGDVHVTQPDTDIRCNRLQLQLDPKTQALASMFAEEKVIARTPQGSAQADSFAYDVKADTLQLEGRPEAVLVQEGKSVRAPRIRVARAGGGLHCDGPGRLETEGADASTIRWQKRMEYEKDKRAASFFGDVVMVMPKQSMRTEQLDAAFTADGKLEGLRCESPGTITMKTDDAKAERTVAWQGRMQYDETKNVATFEKDVVLKEPERELKADVVDAAFDAAGKLTTLKGRGNVKMSEKDTRVLADDFTYRVSDGSGIVHGAPARIWYMGNWVKGGEITFENGFQVITITGTERVTGSGKVGK